MRIDLEDVELRPWHYIYMRVGGDDLKESQNKAVAGNELQGLKLDVQGRLYRGSGSTAQA